MNNEKSWWVITLTTVTPCLDDFYPPYLQKVVHAIYGTLEDVRGNAVDKIFSSPPPMTNVFYGPKPKEIEVQRLYPDGKESLENDLAAYLLEKLREKLKEESESRGEEEEPE